MSLHAEAGTRYIFMTGGVVSSLGKGIAASALAALLQSRGYTARVRKMDPYLNIDPGTMSPYQHGEVFVTEDGAETDLDLGHYERFTNLDTCRSDNITAGQIYQSVIKRERRGDYLGATVQVIPHVTDAIMSFVRQETGDYDFTIIEIGGTVGDIEGLPFLEAIRQLSYELGRERSMFVHLTLLPYLRAAGEVKTKPTQHSVRELRSVGIQPDIVLARSDFEMSQAERDKIALFCNVRPSAVIAGRTVDSIYEVLIAYHEAGLDAEVLRIFSIDDEKGADLRAWRNVLQVVAEPEKRVRLAIVGKYTINKDAYMSLSEAVVHGGIANNAAVDVDWIESDLLEEGEPEKYLASADAILVPGGFGRRGIEGMVKAARFARERSIPYFGICLGMQVAAIEIARNLMQLDDANSSEFSDEGTLIVGLLTEWLDGNRVHRRSSSSEKGGTMRLGSYDTVLNENSLARQIYGQSLISERHRHRYELNANFAADFSSVGVEFSGMSPDGRLPEIMEIADHPFFVGVQFHPELKSRPRSPHPLFVSFIDAAIKHSRLI